jgi:hypothetical protein
MLIHIFCSDLWYGWNQDIIVTLVTRLHLGQLRNQFLTGQEVFLSQLSTPAQRTTRPLTHWMPRVKQPELEADHSPL